MNKLSIKKSRSIEWFIAIIKAIILFVVIWLIYHKIEDPKQFGTDFYVHIKGVLTNKNGQIGLALVLFLMPLNWILEAIKWKKLMSVERYISFPDALKGVMSGVSLGFITPYAIGDYAGRLGWLNVKDKSRYIGSIWLGNAIQMLVTLLFGCVGLLAFYSNSESELPIIKIIWSLSLVLVLGLVFVFLLKSKRFKWIKNLQYLFEIIITYSAIDLLKVLAIAVLRYAVFSIQFLLILFILEIKLSTIHLLAGISWIFLFKSIIPSFNFMSDLGIRELSALTFFDSFNVNQSAVVAGSLLLWLINILIPVIIGVYYVLRMKILKSE